MTNLTSLLSPALTDNTMAGNVLLKNRTGLRLAVGTTDYPEVKT